MNVEHVNPVEGIICITLRTWHSNYLLETYRHNDIPEDMFTCIKSAGVEKNAIISCACFYSTVLACSLNTLFSVVNKTSIKV